MRKVREAKSQSSLYKKLREGGEVAPAVTRSMRGNGRRKTIPEEKLAAEMRHRGLKGYRRNSALLPGSPDFVFLRLRVAVQVHGCFWHRCPKCTEGRFPRKNVAYWTAKFESNLARDQRTHAELEALGYVVIVCWECEIRNSMTAVIDTISYALQERGWRNRKSTS